MSAARLGAIALLGAAVLLIGCSRSAGDRTFVLVTASLEYRAVEGRVALLRAELVDDAGRMDAHEYTAPGGGGVTFPATFTIEAAAALAGVIGLLRERALPGEVLAAGLRDMGLSRVFVDNPRVELEWRP